MSCNPLGFSAARLTHHLALCFGVLDAFSLDSSPPVLRTLFSVVLAGPSRAKPCSSFDEPWLRRIVFSLLFRRLGVRRIATCGCRHQGFVGASVVAALNRTVAGTCTDKAKGRELEDMTLRSGARSRDASPPVTTRPGPVATGRQHLWPSQERTCVCRCHLCRESTSDFISALLEHCPEGEKQQATACER